MPHQVPLMLPTELGVSKPLRLKTLGLCGGDFRFFVETSRYLGGGGCTHRVSVVLVRG
jgi:hypothetical protein